MAEYFGYTPREVDTLSLRELAVMLLGGARKKRDAWKRTATQTTMVYNAGGPRGETFRSKRPSDLYPDLFREEKNQWEKRMKRLFNSYNPD